MVRSSWHNCTPSPSAGELAACAGVRAQAAVPPRSATVRQVLQAGLTGDRAVAKIAEGPVRGGRGGAAARDPASAGRLHRVAGRLTGAHRGRLCVGTRASAARSGDGRGPGVRARGRVAHRASPRTSGGCWESPRGCQPGAPGARRPASRVRRLAVACPGETTHCARLRTAGGTLVDLPDAAPAGQSRVDANRAAPRQRRPARGEPERSPGRRARDPAAAWDGDFGFFAALQAVARPRCTAAMNFVRLTSRVLRMSSA